MESKIKFFDKRNYANKNLSQRINQFGVELVALFNKGKTEKHESNFHYCVSTYNDFWILHGRHYGAIAGHVAFAHNGFKLRRGWRRRSPENAGTKIINDLLFDGKDDIEQWAETNADLWGSKLGGICLLSKLPYHLKIKHRSATLEDIGRYFIRVSKRVKASENKNG